MVSATRTISSADSASSAWRSETWIVTGTTRRLGPASIITSRPGWPHSAARYSVWPGWAKPAAFSTDLAIGLVTIPSTAPARASRTAASMLPMMAGALAGSGRPAPAATDSCVAASTGSRSGNTRRASASEPTVASGPINTKRSPECRSRRQAASVISGPMPEGSPRVSASMEPPEGQGRRPWTPPGPAALGPDP